MSSKTEKKLENLELDVENMEEKFKEFQEKLRKKKLKTEETRNMAIVEIVRENNISIGDLKAALGVPAVSNVPAKPRRSKAKTEPETANETTIITEETKENEEID